MLFLSAHVITQCLFHFQKLDCLGDLCQQHSRTAIMFPFLTISTDSFLDFIVNNRCHWSNTSLNRWHRINGQKFIRIWQKDTIKTWTSKAAYLPVLHLLNIGYSHFTETTAKIFQKHSSSPYHRLLSASCLLYLCFWSFQDFSPVFNYIFQI